MKIKVPIVVMLLALPMFASIAKVGTPAHTNNTTAGTACTITYTPQATGDAIVYTLTVPAASVTSPVMKENGTTASSTYTAVGPIASGTTVATYMWITTSVASGRTSFGATWSGTSRNTCDVVEYSGVLGIGATHTNTGSTSPMTDTVTTTAPNSWVVMGGGLHGTSTYSAGSSCSPNATCTLEDSLAGGGSTSTGVALSDDGNAASSGTAVTVHTTLTSASAWAVVSAELLTTLPAPTMSPNGGSFNNDTSTTFSDTQSGVTFCSTLDGSTPAATTPGTCSTGASGSSATVIATGTTVKVLATKTGWINSAVITSSSFTLTVGPVTDSPGAGTYNSAQTVTLGITTTTGGTVHFTQDNSTATCSSSSYSSPFTASATEHVRAVGCKTNYVTSSEINDVYTISIPSTWMTLIGVGAPGSSGGGATTVTDNFNRSNGALGSNWTTNHGSITITSNQACINSAANTSLVHWSADTFGADQYSQGNISLSGTSGNDVGLGVRIDATLETGYVVHCQGPPGSVSACQIYKGVAGSYTAYSPAFTSPASGDLVKIQVTGSSNPVTITVTDITASITLQTATDDCSAHGACLTSGYPGMAGFNSDTGDCVDNWQGGN